MRKLTKAVLHTLIREEIRKLNESVDREKLTKLALAAICIFYEVKESDELEGIIQDRLSMQFEDRDDRVEAGEDDDPFSDSEIISNFSENELELIETELELDGRLRSEVSKQFMIFVNKIEREYYNG